MTDLAKLVVRLEAQTGKYQRDLEKANKKLDGFARKTKKSISGIKVAFGALAFGSIIQKMTAATSKQETVLRQLEQGLISTGNAAGHTKDELVSFAAELQKATTFGDEDIIKAQSQLITFTNIAGEQFKRTTEAALDLSTRMGQDLTSSVVMLGKALNAPVSNMGALGRAGIQFSDDQKELIKTLAETGRLAEAQTIILNELETQFGGSARAARDTFGGALEGLRNAFGDLLENEGGLTASKEALEEFTTLLQDPRTVASANKITSALIKGFSGVANLINNSTSAINTFLGRAESLGEVQYNIEKIERLLGGGGRAFGERIRFFGPDGIISFEGDEELQQKLDQLIEKRKALLNPLNEVTPNGKRKTAGISSPSPAIDPKIEAKKNAEFDSVVAGLRTEEEALQESYNRRRSIILNNSQATAQEKNALLVRLNEEGPQNVARLRQEAEFNAVMESLRTEEEALLDSYNRRHDIIMASTEATEEEKKELIVRLNDETLQEIEVSVKRMKKDTLANDETQAEAFDRLFGAGALTSLFSDLDNIEDRFKSLLANIAAQALASGISSMFTQGGSFGGGVSSFFGGLFGGAKADGGPVSSGKIHLVGERGPELFVPNVGGTIVPNDKMGGNTSVVINLPNIKDTDTFRKSSGQIAAKYRQEIQRAGRNA